MAISGGGNAGYGRRKSQTPKNRNSLASASYFSKNFEQNHFHHNQNLSTSAKNVQEEFKHPDEP